MTFLRNLGHDLVDKRLWPAAAALVVALIAVPLFLGRGAAPAEVSSAPAPKPVATGAAAAVLPGQAVVSLQQPLTGGPRYRRGPVRNPFVQHHLPELDTSSSVVTAGSGGTTGGVKDPFAGSAPTSGGTGGSGGSTGGAPTPDAVGPGTSPTVPSGDTKPKVDPQDVFRVSLRFGEAGDQRLIKDIARLTPLPSSSDPFFVFLGVLKDGKTAVFLVSSDATATGDGKCRPRATNCETIQLKAGDTEFFDLATGTGGVIQYQLDLRSVSRRKAASTAVASRRRQRESKAGRQILRAAVKQTDLGFDYIPRLGVLEPHDVKSSSEGYVPASVLQGSLPDVYEEDTQGYDPYAAPADEEGYLPGQPADATAAP